MNQTRRRTLGGCSGLVDIAYRVQIRQAIIPYPIPTSGVRQQPQPPTIDDALPLAMTQPRSHVSALPRDANPVGTGLAPMQSLRVDSPLTATTMRRSS